jgi:hypothetical protein
MRVQATGRLWLVLFVGVIRPYLPSRCSGVTQICHMGPPAHALKVVKVRLKSVSTEGHFTLEAERVFCLYLPSH